MKPGQEVSELRKAGRLEEAYRRGKALLKEHPDDLSLKTSMGWVHYERAKQIVTTAKKSGGDQLRLAHDLTGVLREFARLQLPRPNLVLSCLLAQAVKFPTDLGALPGFVMWAGPESFRPEDYQASPRDGKVFPPLLEEVARKTAKAAQKQPSSEIREFALWLLRHALEKAQVQKPEWLRYYEALLLGDSVEPMRPRRSWSPSFGKSKASSGPGTPLPTWCVTKSRPPHSPCAPARA